jgi:hypothetical protein
MVNRLYQIAFLIALSFVGVTCKKESKPTTGDFTFYVTSDLGAGAIKIYVDNQLQGSITQISPNGVTCGSNQGLTISKAGGTYSWRAEGTLNGSWNGTLVIVNGQCDKFEITGVVGGNSSGDVVFWSPNTVSTNCGDITVTCNGVSKVITTYTSASAPDCGAAGVANFNFLAGTYSYTATCDWKTWSGSITITPNICAKRELTEAAAAKYSYISFTNTSYTRTAFFFNNQTKYADPGNGVTFYGFLNQNAVGTATTYGTTSNGNQLGYSMTSNLNYNFPAIIATGFNQNFFIGNGFFFLRIRNTHLSQNITQIIVNQGLSTQKTENVTIPNNGTLYGIGYYNAYSNSNVRIILANGTIIDYTGLGLPFTNNQQLSLSVM